MIVSSSVWLSEKISVGCLLMDPFSIRCYRFFSAEGGCG